MKTCNACKVSKSDEDFHFKNKNLNKRRGMCKECQKEYHKKHYESNKEKYLQRDRSSYRNRIKEHPELIKKNTNICLCCSKHFLSRTISKYCSRECQKLSRRSSYIQNWKSGLVSGSIISGSLSKIVIDYIWDKYDSKCAECGWNKINPTTNKSPLEIHHIDGQWQNSKEDNLILLCPNCHSLTNNYRGSNVGNGRPYNKHR